MSKLGQEEITAALKSAGRDLASDMTGLAQLIIDKVGRPPSAIERGAFGLKVIWKEGAIVDVKPNGVYQLRGTELWFDEDEVARRVIERLDHPKPTLVSFERQIKDVCDQMAQCMRKTGVALLKEFYEKGKVEQVSGDREALILTLRDKGERRLDIKINAHGQVAVVREGSKELEFTESMTTAVKMIHHLLEVRSLLPPAEDDKKTFPHPGPSSSDTNIIEKFEKSRYAATSRELGSLMKAVVSSIGLRPEHGASSKEIILGWMLSFDCQSGHVEMFVYQDHNVLVKLNGHKVLDAPDVSMAVIYLKELLAEEKKEKVLTRPHPPADPLTNLTREIQSHLNNDASHLISKLGLSPSDYSADICASGLTIVIHGRIKATVRCDGTVQVERYDQLVCQSQNIEMVLPFVKELIADDSPCKRKIQVEEEEEEEEDEPPIKQKSPKLAIIEEAEEEPVAPTQLVNLE